MPFGKRFPISTPFIFYILENISICNWKQFQSLISIPTILIILRKYLLVIFPKFHHLGLKRMLCKTLLQQPKIFYSTKYYSNTSLRDWILLFIH